MHISLRYILSTTLLLLFVVPAIADGNKYELTDKEKAAMEQADEQSGYNKGHDYSFSASEEKEYEDQMTTVDMDEVVVEFLKDQVEEFAKGLAATLLIDAVMSSEVVKENVNKAKDKAMSALENVPIVGGALQSAGDVQYVNVVLHFCHLKDSVEKNTKQVEAARKEKIDKFCKGVDTGCNILNTALAVYSIYKKMMAHVETVGAIYSTCRELKELEESLERLYNLYVEFGVRFAPNSLYDLDKYLNPVDQAYYKSVLYNTHEQIERIGKQVGIVFGKSGDKDEKSGDYFRLNEIRRLTVEVKILERDMYKLMSLVTYLVQINWHNQQVVEIKETMWNFWDYNTYSVW